MNIKDLQAKFPAILKYPKMSYLDSAASSLKVQDAIDAVKHYYEDEGSNVGRGTYTMEMNASAAYEATRKEVQSFIHAAHEDEIIFTKGTTQSLNMIAYSYAHILTKEDEIITTELEHHASFLPWVRVSNETGATLIYAPLKEDLRIDVDGLINKIHSKTKIIAITMVSNVMGYVTPLQAIIKKAHEVGAIVICDAAQAAPHIPIDVQRLDCDFLAFSGHKCFGPTGVGVLYGKRHLLQTLKPMEVGGGMVAEVTHTSFTTHELPLALEAGTPPIAQVIGLRPALAFIKSLDQAWVHTYTMQLYDDAVKQLQSIKDVIVHNPTSDTPIVTFSVKGVHAHDIQSFLSEEDIAVRAGHHCAKLVGYKLGVNATVRASIHLYNEKKDIDALVRVVKKARDFFLEN
ncbi:MAG: aminotransferase class V-fold PLP-dependent enzyme [Acholeplasmataceae bacterium]